MPKSEVVLISDNDYRQIKVQASLTASLPFELIKNSLSTQPLRRTRRVAGQPFTVAERERLVKIARNTTPSQEWLDEDFSGLQ